ncbi:hypothetical protein GCM10009718_08570 [Isoptericola halotolerans]
MASADGAEGVREAAKRGPSLQFDGTLYARAATGRRAAGEGPRREGTEGDHGDLSGRDDDSGKGRQGTGERKALA